MPVLSKAMTLAFASRSSASPSRTRKPCYVQYTHMGIRCQEKICRQREKGSPWAQGEPNGRRSGWRAARGVIFCSAGAADCLRDAAGAAMGMSAVPVGSPLAPVVGVRVALSPEDRQGSASRGQIPACAVPRVRGAVAARDQRRQHRAVGKFFGGFGCGVCVLVRAAQIIAVAHG